MPSAPSNISVYTRRQSRNETNRDFVFTPSLQVTWNHLLPRLGTHDRAVAKQFARICVMERGRVARDGEVSTVCQHAVGQNLDALGVAFDGRNRRIGVVDVIDDLLAMFKSAPRKADRPGAAPGQRAALLGLIALEVP